MKFIRFYSINLLMFTALFVGCKKEEEPNQKPGISITKPTENSELLSNYSFEVEGLASDLEGLKSIHIKLSSPNASYDYDYEEILEVSGTDYDYTKWITLPKDVSIGPALIEVFAKDESGEESDHVFRKVFFKDQVEPTLDTMNTYIQVQDSLQAHVFKNEHGVYDSAVMYNYTKGTTLGTISDGGGFRKLFFYVADVTPHEKMIDLTNKTADPYIDGITVEVVPPTPPDYVDITFIQYLPSLQFNNNPISHYIVRFDLYP